MAETGSHEELPIPPQSHDADAGVPASGDALDSVPHVVAEETQEPSAPETGPEIIGPPEAQPETGADVSEALGADPAVPETSALTSEASTSLVTAPAAAPLTASVVAFAPAAHEVVLPQQISRPRVPWWPFFMYLGVWVGAVGAAAWLFVQAPATVSIASEALYPYTVRAGIVLTAFGPLLAVVVWLVAWISAGRGRRSGLLADSLLKGALVTTLGVALWWIMLVVVDRFRFGRLW